MALGHNVLIRGLNSIYLQAPHISSEDAPDFICYAKCWHEVLHGHHEMEETVLFPAIEAKTGEKGIMDGNVEQHRISSSLQFNTVFEKRKYELMNFQDAFTPGLEAYKAYLDKCSADPSSFSGEELNGLIDAFAPKLFQHLRDEIPSLLSLSRFGSKVPLQGMIAAEGRRSGMPFSD
jgi:hypothetical protein